MTDNEIIKALECCNNGWCDNRCPYYGREDIADCREQSGADQLDLIYRQKAEIEAMVEARRIANTNIVKVFAERLKSAFDRYGVAHECYAIVDSVEKEMVEEMVGGNNDMQILR